MESSIFRSFWIAGFESASHINGRGQRVDMIASTHHDRRAAEDYGRLAAFGIYTVRDGARWHLIDKGHGRYDFESLAPLAEAAAATNTQVIWTLMHYGWPDDLDLFSPEFVDRFASYAAAIVKYLSVLTQEIPFYSPINEISFLAWAAARPTIFPFADGRDDAIKRQAVLASLAAMRAIRAIDPRARFVHPEPTIHIVDAPDASDEARRQARSQEESQFEAWDMLAGRTAPELGGEPQFLDIPGINYYHSSQWEHGPVSSRLRWEDEPRDPRWLPLRELIGRVAARYQRPVCIAETSHFGVGRARWIREIGAEIRGAREAGIPVEGVCIYPILDRHEWDDPLHWHNSGLFDINLENPSMDRILDQEYAAALRETQGNSQSADPSIGQTLAVLPTRKTG
jgi:beta-glucosidase/6-phospho-beta-glucosidase/beta-galactosidase